MKCCPACHKSYPDTAIRCLDDGSVLDAMPGDPLLGIVIEDRYRLDAVIGRGGFGTVYRAAHQRLPRDFAVKVLHAARAHEPATSPASSRRSAPPPCCSIRTCWRSSISVTIRWPATSWSCRCCRARRCSIGCNATAACRSRT